MLILFRSKTKFRRFSNDLSIHDKQNNHFHPESINFHAVSFVLWVLITNISSRYGKWILFAYGAVFTVVSITLYYENYRNCLFAKLAALKTKSAHLFSYWKTKCLYFIAQIDKTEQNILKLQNITATISQVVFFTTCEKILIPNQQVTALYSLLFYNVLSYCISYINQLTRDTKWSPYINVAKHSNIKHLAMSATKIVLEITKVVTFIITAVFMLFVLCLEQRLDYYQPTRYFVFLTAIYYVATEKMFIDFFPTLLSYLQIPLLNNLETLWAPVLLSIVAQSLSLSFASVSLFYGAYCTAFVILYLNVYLSYKKLIRGSLKTLNEETVIISQFRYASKDELCEFQDVCAVCLMEMRIARITPCHHIFHTDCLRKCLLNCDKCPVCKRELKFC